MILFTSSSDQFMSDWFYNMPPDICKKALGWISNKISLVLRIHNDGNIAIYCV